MNKIKKLSFCCLSVVLIFVSMCPISAFAADVVTFPCSEPYVSPTTGYIAVKGYRSDLQKYESYLFYYQITPTSQSYEYSTINPLIIIDDIYPYTIYFSVDADEYTTYNMSYGLIHEDGTIQNVHSLTFSGKLEDFHFSFYNKFVITNLDFHGNFNLSGLPDGYTTFEYLFTDSSYEYIYLMSIFQALTSVGGLEAEQLEVLQSLVNSGSDVSAILNEIKSTFGEKLDDIIANSELTIEKLNLILSELYVLHADNEAIISKLNEVFNITKTFKNAFDYYSDIFATYMDIIYPELYEIENRQDISNDLLAQILEALSVQGESNLTSPDTSQMDGYIDVENSLLDNSNVNVSDVVQVEVNQNALTVIWELVERVLNSHAKVFGAVLTVLSLGIVCMVLGRKV